MLETSRKSAQETDEQEIYHREPSPIERHEEATLDEQHEEMEVKRSPTEEKHSFAYSPVVSEHEQSFEREPQHEEEDVLSTSQSSAKETHNEKIEYQPAQAYSPVSTEHDEEVHRSLDQSYERKEKEDVGPRPTPITGIVHSPVEDVPRSLDVSQHSGEHEEALQTSQPSSTKDVHEEAQRRSPSISEHEDETQVTSDLYHREAEKEQQVARSPVHSEHAEDEAEDLHRSHGQSFEHEQQQDEEEVLATSQTSTKEHQEDGFGPRPTSITGIVHSPVEDAPRSLDVSQHSGEHEEALQTSQPSSTKDVHEEAQRRSPSISEHEDETQVTSDLYHREAEKEQQVARSPVHSEHAEDEAEDLHRSHGQSFEHEQQQDEEEVLATSQSSIKENQEDDFGSRPTVNCSHRSFSS